MGKGDSSNLKIEWDKGFSVPLAFKLDHLQPIEPILFLKNFNFFKFILEGQFLLPQRANNQKTPTPNLDETEGFRCLGHSNWTICSLLSQFCSPNFQTFPLSCWEANSYYPRGIIMRKKNSPNSRNGLVRGVSVPWAFKLDHLHPVKPILFSKFYNFFTFILGDQFLLPRRTNNGKREFFQPQKWMRQKVF